MHRPPASYTIQIEEGKGNGIILRIQREKNIKHIKRLNNASKLLSRDVYILWTEKDFNVLDLYYPGVIKAEGGLSLAYNFLPPPNPMSVIGLAMQRLPIQIRERLDIEGNLPLRDRFGKKITTTTNLEIPFGVEGLSLGPYVSNSKAPGDLPSILETIQAPEAWKWNQGEGSVIAILDSGVEGIPISSKLEGFGDSTFHKVDPWVDEIGHGSMAARIALAVAPKAKIISMKPDHDPNGFLSSSSIYICLDWFAWWLLKTRKRTVLNNSWGVPVTYSVLLSADGLHSDLSHATDKMNLTLIANAIGNNRHVAGEATISAYIATTTQDIMEVGAVGKDLRPQFYSSRGPGGVFPWQPGCVGVTYGILPWGKGWRDFGPQGGATSACAPQVTGAFALLDAQYPSMSSRQIRSAIRMGASNSKVGYPGALYTSLTGSGLLQIAKALEVAPKAYLHPSYAAEIIQWSPPDPIGPVKLLYQRRT